MQSLLLFFSFLQTILVLRGTCQGPFFWTLYKLNKMANCTLKTLQSKHEKEDNKGLQADRRAKANVSLNVLSEAVSMLNGAYITHGDFFFF